MGRKAKGDRIGDGCMEGGVSGDIFLAFFLSYSSSSSFSDLIFITMLILPPPPPPLLHANPPPALLSLSLSLSCNTFLHIRPFLIHKGRDDIK